MMEIMSAIKGHEEQTELETKAVSEHQDDLDNKENARSDLHCAFHFEECAVIKSKMLTMEIQYEYFEKKYEAQKAILEGQKKVLAAQRAEIRALCKAFSEMDDEEKSEV